MSRDRAELATLLAEDRERDADTRDRPLNLPNRGPATEDAQPPQRMRADVDLYIVRTDLAASGAEPPRTFVAAGDLLPIGTEDYEREPVAAEPRAAQPRRPARGRGATAEETAATAAQAEAADGEV